MRRFTRLIVCCLIVLGTAFASFAQADEQQANELRARAEEMLRQVQPLHEQGKHDEAQQVEREAHQLREKAEQMAGERGPRPEQMRELAQHLRELSQQWLDATVDERRDAVERIENEIHQIASDTGARIHEIMQPAMETIERKMVELREQGHPELAERIGTRVREMMTAHRRAEAEREHAERNERQAQQHRERAGREERPQNPDRGAMEQRMHHLRVAAENLHQVGMHDLAERLNREAEEIQRGLQGPPPGEDPHRGAMEALQQEFRKLHERLDEINRRLDELNNRLPR